MSRTRGQHAELDAIEFYSNSRITDHIFRAGLNYKLDPATTIEHAPALLSAPAAYKAPIFKTPIRAWTWADAYLGLNGGYGFGKSATAMSFIDAATGNPLLATETSSKLRGGTFGARPATVGRRGAASPASNRISSTRTSARSSPPSVPVQSAIRPSSEYR